MKNSIISLLNEKGYSNTGDNRNFSIRSLNTMIDSGLLELTFVTQERSVEGYGFLWQTKENKTARSLYKIKIFGKNYYGHRMPVRKMEHYGHGMAGEIVDLVYKEIDLYDVLCRVARIISLNKNGFDFLKDGNCNCLKCSGKGIIPEFMHYAEGICFDCAGTGIDNNELKANIDKNIPK